MKRFWLTLLLHLILAGALALLTIDALHLVHNNGQNAAGGWFVFSALGTLTGAMPLIFLLAIFLIDSLCVLLFAAWIAKKALHIKDNDNTLRLS